MSERAQGSLARIPRAPDDDYGLAIVAERRALCAAAAGRELVHVAGAPVPLESARGNAENLVGFAQVPLGIAGPLVVETSAGRRELYVPMATNEGALVASYSRGMRLLASGGGARARVYRDGLTQNPVLVYASALDALAAVETASGLLDEFRALTSGITRHGRLLEARAEPLGRRLVLRLVFATGEAVGINMAAHAADLCSAELARRSGARERYVHGQDVEKRANARALVEGRGKSAVAEATIPRAVLAGFARTTPEALLAIQRTYVAGFAQLGTHNWMVQSANGLAAVLLACGQDVAYLTESATGFLDLDVDEQGDLLACAVLPSLLVGTVGGGTGKGTARECLDLLGLRGPGSAVELAEILAATSLAGDISLLAAFATHEFVAAHERLGRNRPEAGEGRGA